MPRITPRALDEGALITLMLKTASVLSKEVLLHVAVAFDIRRMTENVIVGVNGHRDPNVEFH
eukprot:2713011-Ditylum_brightwellii.AAC.1